MAELESFVKQLERYFLDGGGDSVQLRSRLKELLAAAGESEDEGLTAVLEKLEPQLRGGISPMAEDLMPIIFALRSILKEGNGEKSDGEYVRIDTSGRRSLPASLTPYHRELLESARQRGERLYLLSVDISEACRTAAIEAIERSFAVVQSDDTADSGTVHFLIVASDTLQPESVLRSTLGTTCDDFECRHRHVPFDEVLERYPETTQWYGTAPILPVGSSLERIERTLILLHDLRHRQDEGMGGIIKDIAEGTMTALSSEVGKVCERLLPALRTLGGETGKRVSIRVSGDDGRLSIVHAEMVGAALKELLVNAIQHGIETVAERLRMGKDGTGSIRIDVSQRTHSLGVRIRDDGRGVTPKELAGAFDREGSHGLGWVRRIVEEYFSGRLTLRAGGGTTAEMEIPWGEEMYRARALRRRGETVVVPVVLSSEAIPLGGTELSVDVSGSAYIHGGERGALPLMDIGENGALLPYAPAGGDASYAVVVTAGFRSRAIVADEIGRDVMVVPLAGEPLTVRLGLREELALAVPLTGSGTSS